MGRTCGLASVAALDAFRNQIKALERLAGSFKTGDADAIHDMRVSSRRLRAILSEFRALWVSGPLERFQDLIRGLTQRLGMPRELDVCIDMLENPAIVNGHEKSRRYCVNVLRAERQPHVNAVVQAAAVITSEESIAAREALLAGLKSGAVCYRKMALRRAGRRYRTVRRAYDTWRKSPADEHLHALRIAFKKLRYACEIFRDVFDRDQMAAFLSGLKDAQTLIGDWHDHCVLRNRVLALKEGAPAAMLGGLDELYDALDARATELKYRFAESAAAFFDRPRAKKQAAFPVLRHHDCHAIHASKRHAVS